MENARNLNSVQIMPDGTYICQIELLDAWTGSWESVPYCAREGDPAPVNLWILAEIATGQYSISQWVPPEPPQPPAPSEGPAVL